MTDAKTRAEARRQAILGKGSSRLAKLTSSARGEDAANIYDGSCTLCPLLDAQLMRMRCFFTEPPPQAPSSREPSPFIPAPPHATPLLVSSPRVVDIPPNAPLTFTSPMSSMNDGPQVTAQDPTSILFSMLGDSSMNTPVPILTPPSTSTRTSPPTLPWVFAPVRMVSVTLLVFFFVFWLEPRRYDAIDIHEPPGWERWSLLARSPTDSISAQPLVRIIVAVQTTD